MNQTQTLTLPERLQSEASRRIQNGVFFQIIALLFVLLSYGSEPDQTRFFFIFVGLGFFLVITRGLAVLFFAKKISLKKIYHFQMTSAVLSSLINGLLVADSILHYRILNSQVILMVFVVIGMSTAVISSLAPAPWYQRFYFFSSGIPVVTALFDAGLEPIFHKIGILFLIYLAYLIYCARTITKDLINAYSSEILARQQKKTLRKVINLVPGFVALADARGDWVTTSESFEKYRDSSAFQEICKQVRLGPSAQHTREVTWYENNQRNSFILSTQKFSDLSMVVVGMPAEEIFEMRKELDIQRSKSEFSARLATLGEMAGGIAHEVNNPLAVIIGVCAQISTLIESSTPDLAKITERVDKISKTSFRISKIIAGLQSFARQSDKDPYVQTPLQQVMDDTFELCREKFYHNAVQLNVSEIPDVELPIRSVQVSQVLINLLNNSFDAVKKLPKPVIDIRINETDHDVFIEVSDSGPGIPPEISDRIFDPFFTTKDVGQGTGLGLSISRSIMLDHQGDLQLVKSPPYLTTFQVRLPKLRKSATP